MLVTSVVVAYHPEPEVLTQLCERLGAQGSSVIVVDNSEEGEGVCLPKDVAVMRSGDNIGPAAAFNIGIDRALSDGAECIVLFDQDSEIGEGFIHRLVGSLTPGRAQVVAPRAVDRKTGREYPPRRIGRWGQSVTVSTAEDSGLVPAEPVISSGCAATAQAYRDVGLLDEDLFIDMVDVEWCLRCRGAGVPVSIQTAVTMKHSIGSGIEVALGGLYRGSVHSPMRIYYKTRNALLLVRRPGTPWVFWLHQVVSVNAHHLIQLLWQRDRGARLRAQCRGLIDGILGRAGRRVT